MLYIFWGFWFAAIVAMCASTIRAIYAEYFSKEDINKLLYQNNKMKITEITTVTTIRNGVKETVRTERTRDI